MRTLGNYSLVIASFEDQTYFSCIDSYSFHYLKFVSASLVTDERVKLFSFIIYLFSF